MFLHLDRSSHVPIYLQIKESLRCLIVQETLRPGERLPSTRQLALELGVNRMTVDAAFSQLEADGLVTSHVGRGTFVNRPAALEPRRRVDLNADPEAISRLWAPLFVDHRASAMSMPMMSSRHGAKAISFVAAAPTPDLFPAIDFRRCADSVLKRRAGEISRIGSADGLGALKSYLARWFTQNGMAAGEDEIVITTGCQQSMDLIRKLL